MHFTDLKLGNYAFAALKSKAIKRVVMMLE